ncbi:MAG: Nif3-like dinuclear metal center hexameric protein [Methanosarcina sp.]|uniref:Nif3-like dinuclear metal center hexameric protein n=1 Tax=Methanosarcina sp. TaxID=2213 RepID=UPI0026363CC9|nr:Nif3-like dinuclear metal center hexameric protein [Methanosarcina sp.]MDD3247537.1 Nif3-like dinuclear metal center hexameric protein [Methanosarcina sp.]MDD4248511.1 Nif3-like dinuclear metal center hexameric protein [Methanosarcina sp.]
MKLKKIVQTLEEIAPPELADDFDKGRIGLILGLEDDVNRIAVALDANSYVLKKAAEMRADMLITHHTLIFHPVNMISKSLAASLRIALENGISLYSMHTNYDRAEGGINDVLAARLGLKNIRTSEIGRIGEIEPCSSAELAAHVSDCLQTPVMYAGEKEKISKVMVIGGSCFRNEYLEIARENGVDAFISSELKHDILRTHEDLCLIDATHYATENPGMEALCSRLRRLPGIEVEFIDQPSGLRAVNCRVDKNKVVLDMKAGEETCKQEEPGKGSLEFMLEEQSRNQIRSDYRRSLGNENRRRYLE